MPPRTLETGRSSTTAGLFFSHVRSPRIERHYDRLKQQTGHSVQWHFAFNGDRSPASPVVDFEYCPAERLLPTRYAQMISHGGVQGGFMDVAIMPCVVALAADFVWVIEYDVDFSGDWSSLFDQFAENSADLLTTTLISRDNSQDWEHWRTARMPSHVAATHANRAFNPIMRMSQRLARTYVASIDDGHWLGHYEFTIPSIALAQGLSVEDIGGTSPFCPDARRGRNYANTPFNSTLAPGTFVWRPSGAHYFHEDPQSFVEPDMLYHPVKPDVANWNGGGATSRLPSPVAAPAPRPIETGPRPRPLVSIVMPAHNADATIAEAIESLAQSGMDDIELIVVDDGSDRSLDPLLRAFQPNRCRFVRSNVRTGEADALNKGLSLARGKYVARIDAIDICAPGRLHRQVAFLEEQQDIAFCGTDVVEFGARAREINYPRTRQACFAALAITNCFHQSAVMVHRERVGADFYYDPHGISEDYDLWARLFVAGQHGVNLPIVGLRSRTFDVQAPSTTRSRARTASDIRIRTRIIAHLLKAAPDMEQMVLGYYLSVGRYLPKDAPLLRPAVYRAVLDARPKPEFSDVWLLLKNAILKFLEQPDTTISADDYRSAILHIARAYRAQYLG